MSHSILVTIQLGRMTLSLFLGLLALVHSCWGTALHSQISQTSHLLFHPSCNDSRVLAMAGFALQDINDDRKEGYTFRLRRVANVQEHKAGANSVFYLTMDVLETGCHVLSKKDWKDCGAKTLYNSVYGQCKAVYYVNLPRRILYMPAYNCTVRPVSTRKIYTLCPHCPVLSPPDPSEPKVFQAISESLAKYNKEVTGKRKLYFYQITEVYSQWLLGPAYFVEYLVSETPCTKSPSDPHKCLLLSGSEPVGLCKSSLSEEAKEKKSASISCEFFLTQPTPTPQILPIEHQQVQKQALPPTAVPPKRGSKGSVQILPMLDDEKDDSQQEKNPREDFPTQINLTTEPMGEPLDLPPGYLIEEGERPIVLPFPDDSSRSDECPGPAENLSPLILPS